MGSTRFPNDYLMLLADFPMLILEDIQQLHHLNCLGYNYARMSYCLFHTSECLDHCLRVHMARILITSIVMPVTFIEEDEDNQSIEEELPDLIDM